MASSLALGIGSINALLMPMFPVYGSIFGIMTTPLYFLSGIFYLYEELPPYAQDYVWWNPLVHVTAMMRRGFYGQYEASFVSPTYVITLSMLLTVIGFILLSRFHRMVISE